MKTSFLTLVLVAGVSSIAMAADKTDGKSESFAVEKIICSKTFVPATGSQSPDYKAGVDVDGNPVASADINSVPVNAVPDYVEVPMTIDLGKKMGLFSKEAEIKMPVANLKIYNNGKIEYNGQDISSHTGTLCGVAEQKSEAKDIAKVVPAAGQDQMIAAPSITAPPEEPRYQADTVAPHNIEPVAGSVAPSTTSPPPRIEYKLQQQTVNRAPVNMNAMQSAK